MKLCISVWSNRSCASTCQNVVCSSPGSPATKVNHKTRFRCLRKYMQWNQCQEITWYVNIHLYTSSTCVFERPFALWVSSLNDSSSWADERASWFLRWSYSAGLFLAALNSQVVHISQVVLKTGFTVYRLKLGYTDIVTATSCLPSDHWTIQASHFWLKMQEPLYTHVVCTTMYWEWRKLD